MIAFVMRLVDVLARFGATGELGVLRCGALLPEVEKVLGPPEKGGIVEDHEKGRWPRMWFYRDVQLSAGEDLRITMLLVPAWHSSPVVLPVRERNEYARLRTGVTLSEMTRALDAIGCEWEQEIRADLETIYLTTRPADGLVGSFVFTLRKSWDSPILDDPALDKVLSYPSGR